MIESTIVNAINFCNLQIGYVIKTVKFINIVIIKINQATLRVNKSIRQYLNQSTHI